MDHHQLTSGERYTISALRTQGLTPTNIADEMGRHRSTIYRELERNACNDGRYRISKAIFVPLDDVPVLAVTASSGMKSSKSLSVSFVKNGAQCKWLLL